MSEENLADNESAENVEAQTTEENVEGIELTDTSSVAEEEKQSETEKVKKYTDEEVDEIISKKLSRQKEKLTRDFNKELSRYKRTEQILNAGLGTNNIDDANEKITSFYEEQGVKIPPQSQMSLSQREIEILGNGEAEDIISAGEEKEELDRLLKIDVKDMSPKEKIIFKRLYEKVSDADRRKELEKQGIDLSILNDKDFQDFEKQFSKETKLLDIVDYYKRLNPQNQPQKIGSMKSDGAQIKSYYTPEEIMKLTDEELDNPRIWEAVRKSMTNQKK